MACDDRECRDGIFKRINTVFRNMIIWLGGCCGFLLLLIITTNGEVGKCADEATVNELIKGNNERWQKVERTMGEINTKMDAFSKYVEKTEKLDSAQDERGHDMDKRISILEKAVKNGKHH